MMKTSMNLAISAVGMMISKGFWSANTANTPTAIPTATLD